MEMAPEIGGPYSRLRSGNKGDCTGGGMAAIFSGWELTGSPFWTLTTEMDASISAHSCDI